MLLKWIACTVSAETLGSFPAAQEQWRELAGVGGVLGQIGGWDLRAEGTACVISLWRDAHSYQVFMIPSILGPRTPARYGGQPRSP